jgi:hypothetical protein
MFVGFGAADSEGLMKLVVDEAELEKLVLVDWKEGREDMLLMLLMFPAR